MPSMYRIDLGEFENRRAHYRKVTENSGSLVDILNKINPDSKVLLTQESQLRDCVVDIFAAYDAFEQTVRNNPLFTDKGLVEDTKQDFLSLYALYAACVKGCVSLDELFPKCGKAPVRNEKYTEKFSFKELSGNGITKDLPPEFAKLGLKSVLPRGAAYLLKYYIGIIEPVIEGGEFGFDTVIGLTKGLFESLREKTSEEMKREIYRRFYDTVTGTNIQLDGIVLEGLSNYGKTKSSNNIPNKNFSDVVGNQELVSTLKEVGTRLLLYNTKEQKNPHTVPPTMLILGKPGGGKTMSLQAFYNFLIKNAVNPDSPDEKKEINYISIDSSIKSKWHGESEEKLRKQIELARDPSKISLVYIEDIDALFAKRGNEKDSPIEERITQTLLQLIEGVEVDHKGNYIIIATTNRDYDIDDALKERFRILVYTPGPKTKEERLRLIEGLLKSNLDKYKIKIPGEDELKKLTQFLICEDLDYKRLLETVEPKKIDSYPLSARDMRNICDSFSFDITRILKGGEGDLLPEEIRKSFFIGYGKVVKWIASKTDNKLPIEKLIDKGREYTALKILQTEQARQARIKEEAERKMIDRISTMLAYGDMAEKDEIQSSKLDEEKNVA